MIHKLLIQNCELNKAMKMRSDEEISIRSATTLQLHLCYVKTSTIIIPKECNCL